MNPSGASRRRLIIDHSSTYVSRGTPDCRCVAKWSQKSGNAVSVGCMRTTNIRQEGRTSSGDRLHDIESTRVQLGGIGRSTLFELIRTGELRSVKIGSRRLIPQSQIDNFIRRNLIA